MLSHTTTQEQTLEAVQWRFARMVLHIRRTARTTSTTQLIADPGTGQAEKQKRAQVALYAAPDKG